MNEVGTKQKPNYTRKMKRTLNLATIVALIATVILVMTGCTDPNPAPAERVVNIDTLPTLHEDGEDTTFTSYSSTDFRWKDCDGEFHPAKKFVPSGLVSFTSEGPKFDLREEIGLSEGEELIIRKKRKTVSSSPHVPQHPAPTAPIKKTEPVSTNDGDFFPDWFGELLATLILLFLAALLWRLLRNTARGNQTSPANGDRSGTDERRGDTTIIHSHVEHHHVAQEPMRVAYKGEGEHAMTFEVHGMFSLPLQVKVAKGNEPPTTVTFGRPETKEGTEKTS